jgi:NAD(P)H dehydrogenase (quinone)
MIISIILAHPALESFNHAIALEVARELVTNGHSIRYHDLYHECFDPLLTRNDFPRDAVLPMDIEAHCRELTESDGIVIIHPNWWGQPPAILKGWVDRVIRPGVAYEFSEGDNGEGVPNGLFKNKSVLVFNTSDTPPEREQAVFGDPLELIWKNCVFGLCGVTRFCRKNFSMVVTSTLLQREAWMAEARHTVNAFF